MTDIYTGTGFFSKQLLGSYEGPDGGPAGAKMC